MSSNSFQRRPKAVSRAGAARSEQAAPGPRVDVLESLEEGRVPESNAATLAALQEQAEGQPDGAPGRGTAATLRSSDQSGSARDPTRMGSYERVAPYQDARFVPLNQQAWFQDEQKRWQAMEEVKLETARELVDQTYSQLLFRGEKWSEQAVLNVVQERLQVVEEAGQMKVYLVHDGSAVPAGSYDLPPLVGIVISQAESELKSWVLSALTGLSAAVAGTIVAVFTPVPNTPRTSTNEMEPNWTTPDDIMRQIARILAGKRAEEMLERGAGFDVVEPETAAPAVSTYVKPPVRKF